MSNHVHLVVQVAEIPRSRLISMEEMITHVCKRYGREPTAVADPGNKRNCSKARVMIALLVWYEDHLSLTELGTRLGGGLCSLSQAVNRLQKRAEAYPRLAACLERVRGGLVQIQICQA